MVRPFLAFTSGFSYCSCSNRWFAFFNCPCLLTTFFNYPCPLGGWYQQNLPHHCHFGNASRPKCAQKQYINTYERKKRSLHFIYSCATPLIYIVINREKEEEEQTPIHYYGKSRCGTTVNNEVSGTFPSRYWVYL